MFEKITVVFAVLILLILTPAGVTLLMNGDTYQNRRDFEELNSGKSVFIDTVGDSESVDLEVFLVQVLAAQVAPDVEPEALKAQAVIARTMLRKEMEETTTIRAEDLTLAYLTEAECMRQWGKKRYAMYMKKMQTAVLETYGETLQYEGAYIDALYHSVSMGETISAKEAYDKDIAYLTNVACVGDVESSDYMAVQMYTWEDMKQILDILKQENVLEGFSLADCELQTLEERIKVKESTEHGYVKSVEIGGVEVLAEAFVEAAHLQSHVFYIEVVESSYRIICLGKGHGMGLSQYTARTMALDGVGYKDILGYFYPGAEIVK